MYSGTEKECSASGLDPVTEYNVRVKCVIDELQGEWCGTAKAKTKSISIPRITTVTLDTRDKMEINWRCDEYVDCNATKYEVELANSGRFPNTYNSWRCVYRGEYTFCPLENLERSNGYDICVRCVVDGRDGDWSETFMIYRYW